MSSHAFFTLAGASAVGNWKASGSESPGCSRRSTMLTSLKVTSGMGSCTMLK